MTEDSSDAVVLAETVIAPASPLEGTTHDLPASSAPAAEVTSGVPASYAPATEVTSVLAPSASEDATFFMVDEEQLQHQKKKRKLELQLLEEQILAQRAIRNAMEKFAQVCDKWNK